VGYLRIQRRVVNRPQAPNGNDQRQEQQQHEQQQQQQVPPENEGQEQVWLSFISNQQDNQQTHY
jgi:hypothetical protein